MIKDLYGNVAVLKGLYFGDEVYFVADEFWARRMEGDGIITYTIDEMETVKQLDEITKALVHEAKKYGAVVVERLTGVV